MSTGKIVGLINVMGGSPSGGGGLPAGGYPFKQLVTDADGNTVWADMLAHELSPFSAEVSNVGSKPFFERISRGGETFRTYQVYAGELDPTAFFDAKFFDLSNGTKVELEVEKHSDQNRISWYTDDYEISLNLYDGIQSLPTMVGDDDSEKITPEAGIWLDFYNETNNPDDLPAFLIEYEGGNTRINEKYFPDTIQRTLSNTPEFCVSIRNNDDVYLYRYEYGDEKATSNDILNIMYRTGSLPLVRHVDNTYSPVRMFETFSDVWLSLIIMTENGEKTYYSAEYEQPK